MSPEFITFTLPIPSPPKTGLCPILHRYHQLLRQAFRRIFGQSEFAIPTGAVLSLKAMSIHPYCTLAQLLRLFRKILDLKGRHSLLGFRRETRPPSKSWLSAEPVAARESHPSFRITRLRSSQLCPSLWLPTSSSIFRPATNFQAMTNVSSILQLVVQVRQCRRVL